ncbi:enoyl-CoA hydratase/isomerase family protein [Chloroflexota bacterium]
MLDKKNGIAIITLNNPERLNSLTAKMRVNLSLVADEIAKDDDVRVVIITGAGRGFCSGADVRWQASRIAGETYDTSRYEQLQYGVTIARIFPTLNKPVIAAVNGVATGAGFGIALSCDIRIASTTARFGALQMARALLPGAGLTYFLPNIVGISKALELFFTAGIIGAEEAERLGIVSRVVPPDELMKVTRELADKIVQQAPIPVELTKKIVWRGLLDNLSHQLELETGYQRICHQSEDHKESVHAFLEKRPQPKFKGR